MFVLMSGLKVCIMDDMVAWDFLMHLEGIQNGFYQSKQINGFKIIEFKVSIG